MRTLRFSQIFRKYWILPESDKVRQNTSNDYDLPETRVYIFGTWINHVWTNVYGLPTDAILAELVPQCCNGRLGSINLEIHRHGEPVCAIFRSVDMITHRRLCDEVTKIPADVYYLIPKPEPRGAQTT